MFRAERADLRHSTALALIWQIPRSTKRWLRRAVALVAVGPVGGFEKLFRSGATLGLGFEVQSLTSRQWSWAAIDPRPPLDSSAIPIGFDWSSDY